METDKVARIERLNQTLEKLEYKLMALGKTYLEEVKSEKPDDYELEVVFEFCAGEKEIASWFEDIRGVLEEDWRKKLNWGLASGADHNTALDPSLHGQKHCWLLHLLYDDLHVPWEKILKIDWFWADFRLYFQYDFDLSGVKSISELKKRLLEVQERLLAISRFIRRRARRRVLSGKSNLFDYDLVLDITLFSKDEREYYLPQKGFKFDNPFNAWEGVRENMRDRIFSDIEYQLEGLGLEIEKALEFNLLWANLILTYSHRFWLKNFL